MRSTPIPAPDRESPSDRGSRSSSSPTSVSPSFTSPARIPTRLSDSIVSWLRLAATLSIAFLAASLIETKRDVRIVLGAIALAGVGAVVFAAVNADGLLGDRAGGALGPNALGLVSGLLLVIAAFGAVTTKAPFRIVLVVAGVAGLLLAKSVASFVAVGLVLALGASLAGRPSPLQRVARPVLALAVAGVVVFGHRSARSAGGDTRIRGFPQQLREPADRARGGRARDLRAQSGDRRRLAAEQLARA